jgi:hypothetical protein
MNNQSGNSSQPSRRGPSQSLSPSGSQSIPLRDLQRPGGTNTGSTGAYNAAEEPVSPVVMSANLPGFSSYWEHPYPQAPDEGDVSGRGSPIDHMALQFALPPNIPQQSSTTQPPPQFPPGTPDPYPPSFAYYEERTDSDSLESDRVPLRQSAQPMGRLQPPEGEATPRTSFQTVPDLDNTGGRSPRLLGFDLEPGLSGDRHRNFGDHLSPTDKRRSRSPSSGALHRASSMMRAMSQRVVMISGEGDLVDQANRRERERKRERSRSRSPSVDGRLSGPPPGPMLVDTSYPSQVYPSPGEKRPEYASFSTVPSPPPPPLRRRGPLHNPLSGKSLGIFPPDNPIRKGLCDLLVNPWTEPFILFLIITQTVLLAVEAAPDVFLEGNHRPERWGTTWIDWAMFALFVFFTLEIMARIIVSGLIINPDNYAPRGKKRLRERVAEKYRAVFQPERQKSIRQPQSQEEQFVPTFARSFTVMQDMAAQASLEEQQRLHLARRAFLRHSFNRLDFIAVVSYWITFVLSVTGLEAKHSLYVFRMLSCLRIIRLLALTQGNLVSSTAREGGPEAACLLC